MMSRSTPPEPPACKPDDAELFDNEFTYGMALAICQDCPVKDWCLDWVDPARSYYDGVVGGVAWADGRPMPRYSPIRKQTHLIAYLTRANQLKKLN